MEKIFDNLVTIVTGALVSAACGAVADALDPVGAQARAALTDAGLAAFLEAQPLT